MSRKPSKRMDETGSQRFFRILRGILSYLFVIIILIVSLVPIVWVFMSSFKSNTEILNSALSLPTVWSLKNYVTAFEMVPIATFYGNSAVVAVVATLLNVLVLSMSSYVLARFRFKGSRKLKSLFRPGARSFPRRRCFSLFLLNYENPRLLRPAFRADHLLRRLQPAGFHVHPLQAIT